VVHDVEPAHGAATSTAHPFLFSTRQMCLFVCLSGSLYCTTWQPLVLFRFSAYSLRRRKEFQILKKKSLLWLMPAYMRWVTDSSASIAQPRSSLLTSLGTVSRQL